MIMLPALLFSHIFLCICECCSFLRSTMDNIVLKALKKYIDLHTIVIVLFLRNCRHTFGVNKSNKNTLWHADFLRIIFKVFFFIKNVKLSPSAETTGCRMKLVHFSAQCHCGLLLHTIGCILPFLGCFFSWVIVGHKCFFGRSGMFVVL